MNRLDPPMSQQIFNIAVTEIESVIQPYRVLDDIARKSVTFIRVGASVHWQIVAQRQLTCQYPSVCTVIVQSSIRAPNACPFRSPHHLAFSVSMFDRYSPRIAR